jgi:hypothetical protein
MTRLDLIQAIMAGAGVSQYKAAGILREHDAEVRRKALEDAARRDTIAGMALAGVLAHRVGSTPPEELVRVTLQHVDIMLKELDK